MQIIKGALKSAQKVAVYGPEGIGKSTFASRFPNPLFIDTEGSTKHMDVARTSKPDSWTSFLGQVRYIRDNPPVCKTLVIDTADRAEQLCISEICAKAQKQGIEDFGYGKGYVYLAEEFGRLLNALDALIERGIHVVMTAHAKMRKFEEPNEMGAYDRWELKLQKHTAPLLKEWADMVLFVNYKTYVINVDGQGAEKGKNKVQGGKRVMYTTHHPCWDAKNRHGLSDELPFDYAEIAHCIDGAEPETGISASEKNTPEDVSPESDRIEYVDLGDIPTPFDKPPEQLAIGTPGDVNTLDGLMSENHVSEVEIQYAVASRGYYPVDTPIEKYAPDFIEGVLVACWDHVFEIIQKARVSDLPF